jgi:hypothetical protein
MARRPRYCGVVRWIVGSQKALDAVLAGPPPTGELLASAIVGQWDQAGPGERSDELGAAGLETPARRARSEAT